MATRRVFVEERIGHSYLYRLYRRVAGAEYLEMSETPWHTDPTECLEAVRAAMTGVPRSMTFLSWDPFFYRDGSPEGFLEWARSEGIAIHGIVHRVPRRERDVARFRELASYLDSTIALSLPVRGRLEALEAARVEHLPHHSMTIGLRPRLRAQVRRSIGAHPRQTIFSFMGEARAGKGIGLFLDALAHLDGGVRKRLFLLFGGKGTDYSRDEISGYLSSIGVSHFCDLRDRDSCAHHVVLSDQLFADYLNASDVGVLLYREDQRYCASGLFTDLVWLRKTVLVTADSDIGAEASAAGIGTLLREESPEELARIIAMLVTRTGDACRWSASAEAYRAQMTPTNVLRELARITR